MTLTSLRRSQHPQCAPLKSPLSSCSFVLHGWSTPEGFCFGREEGREGIWIHSPGSGVGGAVWGRTSLNALAYTRSIIAFGATCTRPAWLAVWDEQYGGGAWVPSHLPEIKSPMESNHSSTDFSGAFPVEAIEPESRRPASLLDQLLTLEDLIDPLTNDVIRRKLASCSADLSSDLWLVAVLKRSDRSQPALWGQNPHPFSPGSSRPYYPSE